MQNSKTIIFLILLSVVLFIALCYTSCSKRNNIRYHVQSATYAETIKRLETEISAAESSSLQLYRSLNAAKAELAQLKFNSTAPVGLPAVNVSTASDTQPQYVIGAHHAAPRLVASRSWFSLFILLCFELFVIFYLANIYRSSKQNEVTVLPEEITE